jgi:hypothetical protein
VITTKVPSQREQSLSKLPVTQAIVEAEAVGAPEPQIFALLDVTLICDTARNASVGAVCMQLNPQMMPDCAPPRSSMLHVSVGVTLVSSISGWSVT